MSDPERMARLAVRIERRGWTVPAVLLLHISRPFTFVAAQGLLLCQPLAAVLHAGRPTGDLAGLLAERGNLDHLLACLEQGSRPEEEG